MTPAPETITLCQMLSPEYLSTEQIYQEFVKLLLQGEVVSQGLQFLKATYCTQFFPEVHAMIGLQQDLIRHPEGDTFQHWDIFNWYKKCFYRRLLWWMWYGFFDGVWSSSTLQLCCIPTSQFIKMMNTIDLHQLRKRIISW